MKQRKNTVKDITDITEENKNINKEERKMATHTKERTEKKINNNITRREQIVRKEQMNKKNRYNTPLIKNRKGRTREQKEQA